MDMHLVPHRPPSRHHHHRHHRRHGHRNHIHHQSKYKAIKTTNNIMYYSIRKRYESSRFPLMIIAACHALYVLINFMVMSQASLASIALKGLTQLTLACKMAFFLAPPTTAYNVLHQVAIWMLCYAISRHGAKIRRVRAAKFDTDEDEEDEEVFKKVRKKLYHSIHSFGNNVV